MHNDDERMRNLRVFDADMDVNSGVQKQGETAEIRFDAVGEHAVICGIHPEMRLEVQVASAR